MHTKPPRAPRHTALCAALLLLVAGCANNDTSPTSPAQDMAGVDMPGMTQDMPGTIEDMPADMPGTTEDMPGTVEDMPGMTGCPVAAPAEAGVARTAQGLVRGVRAGQTWAYKNIPFAAPPTGALRWRPPQQPACWAPQVREGVAFGARCPQLDSGSPVGDEDCLTLNVWVPDGEATAGGRPVMVYIHGGGNLAGAASQALPGGVQLFDGQALAERHGVVVVTIQYRLGSLGFLALPQLREEDPDGHVGNYGALDQIAALRWVQENIVDFQGDKANVMVFGESAGALNTCALIASPRAAGLFHSALMQSGGCVAAPLASAEAAATAVLPYTGCADAADVPACLRALDAKDLISKIPGSLGIGGNVGQGGSAITYGPVVDGWVLPRAPLAQIDAGEHNKVPVIVGSNSEEMASEAIFSLRAQTPEQYEQVVNATILSLGLTADDAARVLTQYPVEAYSTPQDALIQVFTDATFTCAARTAARKLAAHQPPVRRYLFSRRPTTFQNTLPASHGLELLYVFNTLTQIPLYRPAPEDLTLATQMMQLWANLARHGDPNDASIAVTWPAYTTSAETTFVLDAPLSAQDGLRGEACDLWDELLTRAGI